MTRIEYRILVQLLWAIGCRVSEALQLCAGDLIRQGSAYHLRVVRLKRRQRRVDLIPLHLDMALKLEDWIQLRNILPEAPQ